MQNIIQLIDSKQRKTKGETFYTKRKKKRWQKNNYIIDIEHLNKQFLVDKKTVQFLSDINLCADALEQFGYQAITGLWGNMYLSAAYELRNPETAAGHNIRYMDNKNVIPYISASLILDYQRGSRNHCNIKRIRYRYKPVQRF